MPKRPYHHWNDDDTRTLKRLNARGMGLNAVAREMDIARSTVSKQAQRLGLQWDRRATIQALQARSADAKARRVELQIGLLGDAERLRARLWSPHVAFNFGGRDNTYTEKAMDEPPEETKLKILQAVGIAIDKSLKLAEHDSEGLEVAKSLLGNLSIHFGLTKPEDEEEAGEPESADA